MTAARFALPTPGTCRVCGCTDAAACGGGCSWVRGSGHTLCSTCAGTHGDVTYTLKWIAVGLVRRGDSDKLREARAAVRRAAKREQDDVDLVHG